VNLNTSKTKKTRKKKQKKQKTNQAIRTRHKIPTLGSRNNHLQNYHPCLQRPDGDSGGMKISLGPAEKLKIPPLGEVHPKGAEGAD